MPLSSEDPSRARTWIETVRLNGEDVQIQIADASNMVTPGVVGRRPSQHPHGATRGPDSAHPTDPMGEETAVDPEYGGSTVSENERLVRFITDRIATLGVHGPTEPLATGVMGLVTAYSTLQEAARGQAPDYATGVVDGLGQALRYIAGGFPPSQDNDFPVDTAALPEAWTDTPDPTGYAAL
ncbi:hypothetical protein [Streptomyces sp. NPDC097619]|uniref:hypothetical protein n=1 Tax=Streptomyces sp. NPDC097619 TaxID=3157228 RepID=UPI0033198269